MNLNSLGTWDEQGLQPETSPQVTSLLETEYNQFSLKKKKKCVFCLSVFCLFLVP